MLVSLQVRNLALVDAVTVEFAPGLNVITGETGAGKSVLMGALGLVLGNRADKELIRTGETDCSAQAVFHLPDCSGVDALLEDQELPPCEDGELIVRRTVRTEGANKQFVNDAPVTLNTLKQLGQLLVDMHGPHDHQSLFDPGFQRDLLDAFGQHTQVLTAYADVYRAWQETVSRRAALEGPDEGVAEQIDLLTYRVQELEEAGLDAEEEEKVREEHQVLGNAQEIQGLAQGIAEAMLEGDGSAFDGLAVAQRCLEDLAALHPAAVEWRDEAKSIAVQLQELHRTISSELEGLESDPGRLQWLDDRLTVYQKMLRKYGPTVADALAALAAAKEKLGDLSSRGQRLAELSVEVEQRRAEVVQCGDALNKARKKAAKKLAAEVTKSLRHLGFAQSEFSVAVEAGEPGPHGADGIEFGFAPNPGEAMRPLRAIASSGEISRVMLATKRVLAKLDRIPVLVFDEIDANIGGEIGTVVGQQLADLATHHQVLCITHLPQVAVCGATHYAVEKHETNGRTVTSILALDEPSRAEEVARMLGGKGLTSVTLKHAREMLAAGSGKGSS